MMRNAQSYESIIERVRTLVLEVGEISQGKARGKERMFLEQFVEALESDLDIFEMSLATLRPPRARPRHFPTRG